MNGNTDFDRIAQSWLQDGPTEMPDRSLQAALDEVHVTSQRRFGAARRVIPMNGNTWRVAAAAVIGLLIIIGGGIFLGGRQGGVGGRPATAGSNRHAGTDTVGGGPDPPWQVSPGVARSGGVGPCHLVDHAASRLGRGRRRLRRQQERDGARGLADRATDSTSPARTTRSSAPSPGRASTSCSLHSPASRGSKRVRSRT